MAHRLSVSRAFNAERHFPCGLTRNCRGLPHQRLRTAAQGAGGAQPDTNSQPLLLNEGNGKEIGIRLTARSAFRQRRKSDEQRKAEREADKVEMRVARAKHRDVADQQIDDKLRVVIVDGYNAIFGDEVLKRYSQYDLGSSRSELSDLAAAYAEATGQRVYVVYDAMYGSSTEDTIVRLEGGGQAFAVFTVRAEADTYISRLTDRMKERRAAEVILVSRDHAVQHVAIDLQGRSSAMEPSYWLGQARQSRHALQALRHGGASSASSRTTLPAGWRRQSSWGDASGGGSGSSGDDCQEDEDDVGSAEDALVVQEGQQLTDRLGQVVRAVSRRASARKKQQLQQYASGAPPSGPQHSGPAAAGGEGDSSGEGNLTATDAAEAAGLARPAASHMPQGQERSREGSATASAGLGCAAAAGSAPRLQLHPPSGDNEQAAPAATALPQSVQPARAAAASGPLVHQAADVASALPPGAGAAQPPSLLPPAGGPSSSSSSSARISGLLGRAGKARRAQLVRQANGNAALDGL